jgi:threonine aldolase
VLAAAGLIALEKHPARLHEDHENARFLADALDRIPGIRVTHKVETNIIVFDVSGTGLTTADLSARMAQQNVLANGVNPQLMRFVTHMDVDRAGCETALEVVRQACRA